MSEKSGFMGTLKKLMTIVQIVGILIGVIGFIVFALDPDFVMGFFFDFIGMPQMMSEKEVIENPDETIEKCEDSKMGPDFCYYTISQKLTSELPDKAMHACDHVSDSDMKDNCYREIAFKFYDEDVNTAREACKQMIDDKNKDNCYFDIARNLRGVSSNEAVESCKLIKNDYNKYDCFSEVWITLPEIVRENPDKSIEICKMLKVRKDECFNGIARTLRSTNPDKAVEACDGMGDRLDRDDCYYEVWLRIESTITDNPAESIILCGKLSTNQDNCYWDIAFTLSNVDKQKALEACEKITRPDRKRDCKESV